MTKLRRLRRAETDQPNNARSGAGRFARAFVLLLLPLVLAALVAACDSGSSNATVSPTVVARAPYQGIPEGAPPNLGGTIPDPKEVLETKPAGQLPDFLQKAPAGLRDKLTAMYQAAAGNYDDFSYVPCYCGCAMYTHAHRSLASCFIKERKPNGDIVFTDHSVECDTCQRDAQIVMNDLAAKKSLKDTRADVYNQLKYTGVWTDTPPVP